MVIQANIYNKSEQLLRGVNSKIRDCKSCPLHTTRNNIVPGEGNAQAYIMFIGEGPGESEDLQGLPFVGQSGSLLDQVFSFASLERSEVFIGNVIKCRPPGNRNPSPSEIKACCHFLEEQIRIINPRIIVTLGKISAEHLIKRPIKITKENGHLHFLDEPLCKNNPPIMTVFHPAYILRNRKPEIQEAFFQAIKDAKEIAYG